MVRKGMKNFQETYVDFLIVNNWLIVVMCQAEMTNPHIPLPCSKNPSDLEGDDIIRRIVCCYAIGLEEEYIYNL